jgi:hypothetical protein
MTRALLLLSLLCGPSAASALAQEAPNATRKVEISYLFMGSVRAGGEYKTGRCNDVAVTVTESVAIVGALCGTHQNLRGTQVEADDSLGNFHGGPRYRKRYGSRITAFGEALAGVETAFRHGGYRSNTGFSIKSGGGVDFALKQWIGLRTIHVIYQTTWIDGGTVQETRFHGGLVFRLGKRSR